MAFCCPSRLAIFKAQALSHDHLSVLVNMTCAASYRRAHPTQRNPQGNCISDLSAEVGEEGVAPTGSFDFAAV